MALDINRLLKAILAYRASDLHLVAGTEPQIRIDNYLVALDMPVFSGVEVQDIFYSLLTEKSTRRKFRAGLRICCSQYWAF